MLIVVVAVFASRDRVVRVLTAMRTEMTLGRARTALNDPRALPARITADSTLFASFTTLRPASRLAIAAALSKLAAEADGDVHARAIGLMHLLDGKCRAAAASFRRIRIRGAGDWNDLGAASICTAQQDGRPEAWLTALASIDRALLLDPAHAEAQFNRAAIIHALGLDPLARSLWQSYARIDPDSSWTAVARRRLAAIAPSDMEAWQTAIPTGEHLPPSALVELTHRYPQPARRYAEGMYIPYWAKERIAGELSGADQHLATARTIAATLERRGEPILADAIRAIDRAADHPARLEELTAGTAAYLRGRHAFRNRGPSAAEPEFRSAMQQLRRAGTPFALIAEFWLAGVLTEQNRPTEATAILNAMRSREAEALRRYPSLAGHVDYQLALIDAVSGNWTASLAAAERSRAAFMKLGERGFVANATAILSETYDFLGQPQRAWDAGAAALRESAADGTYDRTRAMLAGLCRIELRGGRWERAWTLARLEAAFAPFAPDARMEPDMFVRHAAAQWHLNHDAAALHWLGLARSAVARIPDEATREKLLADVAAAEGTFVRRINPRRAITLLASAIDFQQKTTRPIILPELHLQRGRAHLAIGALDAAEADFEAGLTELERQREAVREAELRPGIFDDASQLFDEATGLQIRRGAGAERVLHTVERGRARAVLEQLDARDGSWTAPKLPRIDEIQSALPAGAALLEYVSLPEQMIVFVITRERMQMRKFPVSRAALTEIAAAFIRNRGTDGAALHDLLIAPLHDDLRGVTALNIVADDFLQRVPFAALYDRTAGRFLIQQYELGASLSAGVFLAGQTGAQPQLRRRPSALVFANPDVPREEFGDLASLAGAELEARRIARHYSRAELFTRGEATAQRFFELAPQYDFVHFAGHGVINEREPYASALVCARTEAMRGGVTARDIARMNFHSTRAVILAACSTMTGRNAAVEGVPSLARAFLIAGVPAVIGTLWDIEDDEAAAVTNPLHAQLARGVNPGEALRNAQLAAIERRVPPPHWSAFALMGNVP